MYRNANHFRKSSHLFSFFYKLRCKHGVSIEFVSKILQSIFGEKHRNQRIFTTWEQATIKSFLEHTSEFKECPSGCAKIIRMPARSHGSPRDIKCQCGLRFCSSCNKAPHFPLPCKAIEVWESISAKETPSVSWIMKNTKACPMCTFRMEKQAGCNHVKCLNGACMYNFCWECSNSWSNHGNLDLYQCRKEAKRAQLLEETQGEVTKTFQIYNDNDLFTRYKCTRQCEETLMYVKEMILQGGNSQDLLPFFDTVSEMRQLVENALILTHFYNECRQSIEVDKADGLLPQMFHLTLDEIELKVLQFTGLASLMVSTDTGPLKGRLLRYQDELHNLGRLLLQRMIDVVKFISTQCTVEN
jgi:IBR domain, a half RING-finger domain